MDIKPIGKTLGSRLIRKLNPRVVNAIGFEIVLAEDIVGVYFLEYTVLEINENGQEVTRVSDVTGDCNAINIRI